MADQGINYAAKYEAAIARAEKAESELASLRAERDRLREALTTFSWAVNEAARQGRPIEIRVGSRWTSILLEEALAAQCALGGE